MPISQINPDGSVKIVNSLTGEVKDVKPDDLASYNPKLVSDYQTKLKTQTETNAYTQSVMAGSIKPESIPESQRGEVQVQLNEKKFDPKKQKADDAKKEILQSAQAVQAVINNKDRYTDDKEYQDALRFASSRLSAAQGFGEGGKTLSGSELGILSGSLINIEPQRKQNVIDRLTGYVPPATGKVLDDEETIKNKMENAISYIKTGKLPDPKNRPKGQSKETFLGNVVKDAKNIGNDILGLPGIYVDAYKKGVTGTDEDKKRMLGMVNPVTMGASIGNGLLSNLNKDIGEPLKGGDIIGRVGKNFYERPVGTTLDVLPFIGEGVSAARGLSTGAKVAEGAESTSLLNKAKNIVKTGQKEDLAGRAATRVATPDLNSVTKSEKIMADALKTTDSITRRGMAKELEANIPKIGAKIDEYATNLDKKIGGQPLEEISSQIDQNLSTTSPVQAHPDEYLTVKKMLNKDLEGGYLADGRPGTTITKINDARKNLNQSIPSSWFKNGMPTSSRADIINAIKWDMSNQLKTVMSQADESGYFNRAIDMQHTAFQASPVLSQEALTSSGGLGMYGIVRSAWDKVSATPTIMSARQAQGAVDPLTQQILTGQLPPITAGESATLSTNLPAVENKFNLPTINPNTEAIDLPSKTLVRDKRMKASNPNAFRSDPKKN